MRQLEERVFLGFVAAATLAMAWIAMPFFGAILWALVAAIMIKPAHRRLVQLMPTHPTTAALLSLFLLIGVVIVPAAWLVSMLIDQAVTIYNSIESRQIDLVKLLRDVERGLPPWMREGLDRMGMVKFEEIQDKLVTGVTEALRIGAGQAVNIGQGAFSLVVQLGIMLYLAYFLIRDSDTLARTIGQRIPLPADQRRRLFSKFTTVIRATVKGSFVVAIVQGTLGGTIFAFLGIQAALLWGVVMGMFSLVPAIGTGIVWVPVAIYLLATGAFMKGIILIIFGVLVIGMVDNLLRPILVGKDTRMPDYLVLIATLGGLSVFGMNGIVVGPVIAAMFMAAWEIFGEERLAQEESTPAN